MDYIGIGRAEGGRVLAGGAAGDGAGYFVQPTVFTDVRQDARIAQEEIFGPVVVAQPFDTLDDAVRLANDSAFGLGASLWSNDLSRVQRLIPRIDAGTVWVNTHNMLDPNMPFGGFKQSGIGREHGRAVIEIREIPAAARSQDQGEVHGKQDTWPRPGGRRAGAGMGGRDAAGLGGRPQRTRLDTGARGHQHRGGVPGGPALVGAVLGRQAGGRRVPGRERVDLSPDALPRFLRQDRAAVIHRAHVPDVAGLARRAGRPPDRHWRRDAGLGNLAVQQ
ncbi:hypothetical protein G6F22_014990 [Rhizopus arrhizus]|nr:hypothetical protein G6F22_014990 [Rhizopus arrhizus]